MLVSYYLPGKRAPQPHAHLAYGPTLRAVVEELHLTLPHGGWAGGFGFGLRLRAMIRRWMSKVFSFTALTNPAWLVGDGWEDYMTHF